MPPRSMVPAVVIDRQDRVSIEPCRPARDGTYPDTGVGPVLGRRREPCRQEDEIHMGFSPDPRPHLHAADGAVPRPWPETRQPHLVFQAIAEAAAGEKWRRAFQRTWRAFRAWFLSEGEAARPTYLQSLRMLRRYMPELEPTYHRLVDLAGGTDLPARFLSLWRPPPFSPGCSQLIWTDAAVALMRNYDYAPHLCDGIIVYSAWTGTRVIGMSDCLWGLVDGMNEHGLAASMAFGGRKSVGDGFGVALVLRYVLEVCCSVVEAVAVLARVPVQMSYTIAVVDRDGAHATVYLAPDQPPRTTLDRISTNLQGRNEWREYAKLSNTRRRQQFLAGLLRRPDLRVADARDAFLASPLYGYLHGRTWGTLYTAIYRPAQGEVEYLWPGYAWRQSFAAFTEGSISVHYGEPTRIHPC
jgi:predicted choloylglycine hydrolase